MAVVVTANNVINTGTNPASTINNDIIIAIGAGDKTIEGGGGNDIIRSTNGNDTITTLDGNDNISAGNGANVIDAGDGNNIVTAGTGNDTIVVGTGNDIVNAGNGNNTITDSGGNNIVTTGSGIDSITTGGGNDIVNAGAGDNVIGADDGGRDLLARTIWGGRMSLLVGSAAVFFALVIGGTIGLVAGFYGGGVDRAATAAFDIMLAFPGIILALMLLTSLGRELQWVLLAMGILAIAPVGRLARANTMVHAQRDFVTVARAQGAKGPRIIVREILPNIVVPMASLALLGTAAAIVAEGSLAFLGLSVEGSTNTWGKMIVAGSSGNALREAPQMAFVPITAMFSTLLALNLIGDRLRARYEARESML